MKVSILTAIAFLLLIPTQAAAQRSAVCWVEEQPAPECPKEEKEKCTCEGKRGPRGPKGEKGDKGDVGPQGPKGEKGDFSVKTITITHNVATPYLPAHRHNGNRLQLGLGWMGAVHWPARDYAWTQGPSLRVSSGAWSDTSANLELGWAPERKGAFMLRATFNWWDWLVEEEWIGFGLGMFWQSIGTADDAAEGHYVGLLPEVAFRVPVSENVGVVANVGPAITYSGYDDPQETRAFNIGFVGSAGVLFNF